MILTILLILGWFLCGWICVRAMHYGSLPIDDKGDLLFSLFAFSMGPACIVPSLIFGDFKKALFLDRVPMPKIPIPNIDIVKVSKRLFAIKEDA